jgi:cytochrome c553
MKSRISNRSISRRISALAVATLLGACAIGGTAFAQNAPATPAATPAAAPAAPGPIVGNVDAARNKVSMCIGCHGLPGYRSSFPEVYNVPMIAGQNAKYIETALNEYKSGSRSHLTMVGIAKSLSEQDIADVAAYYSNLK